MEESIRQAINSGLPEDVIIYIHGNGDLSVMQSGVAAWLDLMLECPDRVDTYCTLANRACYYAKCPGNNCSLNGE